MVVGDGDGEIAAKLNQHLPQLFEPTALKDGEYAVSHHCATDAVICWKVECCYVYKRSI